VRFGLRRPIAVPSDPFTIRLNVEREAPVAAHTVLHDCPALSIARMTAFGLQWAQIPERLTQHTGEFEV
jgi:hypothetical protein